MIFFLVVIAGCDAPTRSRFPSASSSSDSIGAPGTGGFTPTPTPTLPVTPTTPGMAQGFDNCAMTGVSLMYDPYATCVEKQTSPSAPCPSKVSLCKSSLNEAQIRFTTTVNNTSNRYCIIPTYKDAAGNSTYIGNPQCTYVNANQVYNTSLEKNRSGFSAFPINGMMVMFESMLVEYFGCMDGYTKFLQANCPVNQNSACVQAASNYRAQVCNQFKTKYANYYLDLNR